MSYLVLARKWRPQRFDELVGQEHVARTLENAIKNGRIHHAYLFCGPRGVGKTSAARILAKAINCETGPTPTPCNECLSCREITQGTGVDVFEIDGASNTGVDDIRELRENVRYLPAHSRFKIFIIDEVHMLSISAFNALLKVLEEPPPHVKFIFATTESHKIPATILSRCQRFDFRRLPAGRIAAQLQSITDQEGISISPLSLHLIARQAEGSMRDALSTLDQVVAYSGETISDEDVGALLGVVDRSLLLETAAALLRRDSRAVLETVLKVDEIGFSIRHFCKDLIETFRSLIFLKIFTDAPKAPASLAVEAEGLQPLTKLADLADLERDLALLLKLEKEVSTSSFPLIALESGLLRIGHLPPGRSVADLIERLAVMEKRLGGAPPPKSPLRPGPPAPGPVPDTVPPPAPAAALIPEPEPEETASSAADRGEDWPAFVAHLHDVKPILAAQLATSRLLSFTSSRVELGFQKDTFGIKLMKEPSTRQTMEELMGSFFGHQMTLAAKALTPQEFATCSLAAMTPGERLKQEALDHPAVKSVLKILGGRVEEVTPLGETCPQSDSSASNA
jgi:DNA polymerase-3 subunit gamma/tau